MKKLLFCVIFLMITVQISTAQVSRFNEAQYVNEEGDTLNYRVAYPDFSGSQSYPLLIFLHGGGERGDDNVAQLKWGVQNFVTDEWMKSKYISTRLHSKVMASYNRLFDVTQK